MVAHSRWLGVLLVIAGLAGCQQLDLTPRRTTIADVRAAYDAGDYQTARDAGSRLAANTGNPQRHEAAYLAALSALQLNEPREAVPLLRTAARSDDWDLVHDAQFQLGLVYGQLGRHDQAARTLLDVARHLSGRRRADAYFHAAMSQRELDRYASARTNLILARAASVDETQWRRADAALSTTGFALELAAYDDIERAREHARALAESIEAAGYGPPRVVTITQQQQDIGRVRHHVRFGRFPSHWSASAARRETGAAGALIVPLSE